MNRIPRTGKTILSADRYIIKEVELEPEERARLDSRPETSGILYRSREILEECADIKQEAKHTQFCQQ